jgi:hypothetical protein
MVRDIHQDRNRGRAARGIHAHLSITLYFRASMAAEQWHSSI